MIYGFFLFIATLVIDLAVDYGLWLKGKRVNHVLGAALRTAALVLCVIFLGWWSIPMILFLYWLLFDGLMNLLMGEEWDRIGTTAYLDLMQRRYPVLVYLKYGGAILGIILFIIKGAE